MQFHLLKNMERFLPLFVFFPPPKPFIRAKFLNVRNVLKIQFHLQYGRHGNRSIDPSNELK